MNHFLYMYVFMSLSLLLVDLAPNVNGFIACVIEHCTGNAKVMGLIVVEA